MTTRVIFGSQSSLREGNRARIIDTIKQFGGLTQVELADATGLSQATVSIIVAELVQSGVAITSATSRNGRRATFVSLARQLGLVAGVHIGRRMLSVALGDLSGEVVAEHNFPLAEEHRADTTLDRAALLISDMLESINAPHSELRQVAVGVPAPLDQRTGKICSPGIMRGWDDFVISDAFAARMNTPTVVDNGANLGALAEYRLGAGQGCSVMGYLDVGPGIGAGIMINGSIFRGTSGTAGEIGHMTVDPNGPICYCGNRGCLEMVAGARAMIESLRITHGDLALRDLIQYANAGDSGAKRVIADACDYIGIALAQFCNLFDPQRIIVGGQLADTGDVFLEPLRLATDKFTLPSLGSSIDIVPSVLGTRSVLLGAVQGALDIVQISDTKGYS